MDRLVYTALSGMRASARHQQALANNLANAQTTGFRKEVFDTRPITLRGEQLTVRAMQQGEVRSADLTPGDLHETGRALDAAAQGNALFVVQAPDGSESYTRRGDFVVDGSGLLTTGDGHPVIGEGGPITLPLDGKIVLDVSGGLSVIDPAQPGQEPVQLAKLKLVNWTGSAVAKGVDGLFRAADGGILPEDLDAQIKPGFLEKSNVQSTEVLVDMIDSQRLFAARTKLLTTARDIDEAGSQLLRLR